MLPIHTKTEALTEQPAPLPKHLVLEIGGVKSTSNPSLLPPSAVVIDARMLPNPYTPIKRGILEPTPSAILEWMILAKPRKASTAIDNMVHKAVSAFVSGLSVRIQCYGGAHRSQTVAWKVLRALNPEVCGRIEVVCLDAPPLCEW